MPTKREGQARPTDATPMWKRRKQLHGGKGRGRFRDMLWAGGYAVRGAGADYLRQLDGYI